MKSLKPQVSSLNNPEISRLHIGSRDFTYRYYERHKGLA